MRSQSGPLEGGEGCGRGTGVCLDGSRMNEQPDYEYGETCIGRMTSAGIFAPRLQFRIILQRSGHYLAERHVMLISGGNTLIKVNSS